MDDANAQPPATLFTPVAACPATRENVEALERAGGSCPLCPAPASGHEPEAANVVRLDDGRLDSWMLSLPRTP